MASILVTGGAGYIGSHIVAVLAAARHRCIVIDNYSNSAPASIERVRKISPGEVLAFEIDIRDTGGLRSLLSKHRVDSVIHLAGLKSVGESVELPEKYFDNNVAGTQSLVTALAESSTRKFVFSSSATVYGRADKVPIPESAPTVPENPYGETKLAVEELLCDLAGEDPSWRIANLRYFNPVGAHESGLIGEDPNGVPNNLMPFVCQVAARRQSALRIYGRDYPTPDGTGVRDFIHVMDLAEGHLAALEALDARKPGSVLTVNLGTGRGYSVLELVEAFEKINGVSVPRVFSDRRPGDVDVCYADCSLARTVLGWSAKRGIEEMCRDAWRWQRMNPFGYREAA